MAALVAVPLLSTSHRYRPRGPPQPAHRAGAARGQMSSCIAAVSSPARTAARSSARGTQSVTSPAGSPSASPSCRRATSHPALGTVVPHEGGPGYSTTGSGPLRADVRPAARTSQPAARRPARHRSLRADRLPGRCRTCTAAYAPAAGKCGRSLGIRSDNYTTRPSPPTTSPRSSERCSWPGRPVRRLLRHVLRPGVRRAAPGPAAQRRARQRLPDVRRDRVVPHPDARDAARRSPRSCARSPACATRRRTADAAAATRPGRVRVHPYAGHEPRRGRPSGCMSWSTAKNLVSVAFGATYGPPFYRELAASLRSALLGDTAPLLRLTAEATGGSSDAGPIRAYSEGLDAAVACHDYPQLFDMTAPPRSGRARARRIGTPGEPPPSRGVRAVHRRGVPRAPTGRSRTGAPSGRSPRPTTRPVRRGRRAATTRRRRCSCSRVSSTRSPRRPRARSSPDSSRTPGRSWSPTASTSRPQATPTAAR